MKVDNISAPKNDQPRTYSRRGVKLKKYQVLFIIALAGVFFVNGISTVYKLLNLKEQVTYATYQGYNEFMKNVETRDSFSQAKQYFLDAKGAVNKLTNVKNFGANITAVDYADTLLQISLNLTESAQLTLEIEQLINFYFSNIDEKKDFISLREKIAEAVVMIDESVELFDGMKLEKLRSQLTSEQFASLTRLKDGVYSIQGILSEMQSNIKPLLIFLGDRYPHRVLILFQNNNEIRPTGGFIGSLGFLDLNDGRIEKLEVRDVYDFDGQAPAREPNSEIAMVAGHDWGIRDSNTSPDFAISAYNAKTFLEEAGGPGVDSVLAVDLEFVRSVLEVTGPIYIEEFDLTLTAENYDIILSYLVESKKFGQTTPKEILKYFLAGLQEKVLTELEPQVLFALLADSVQQKHIQAYSDDSDVQRWFVSLGLAGNLSTIRPYDDYLNVVNISVGGNKSDAYISQSLKHETFIKNDGTILNQLKIHRAHTWNQDSENWLRDQLATAGIVNPDPEMIRILGKDRNKVMTRVYVPYGAKLTSIIGVNEDEVTTVDSEVTSYNAISERPQRLSYFSFPMTTEIGNTSEVLISYELPFKLDFNPLDDYRLFFDKQAGVNSVDFKKYIYYGNQLRSFAHNPAFVETEDGELYQAILHTDRILSVAVGRDER